MSNKINKYNPSGCRDDTAQKALNAIQTDQDDADMRVAAFIKAIKIIADQCGFDLMARIEIRDRRTRRIYR